MTRRRLQLERLEQRQLLAATDLPGGFGTVFYVNDNSIANDAWTTAPGDDSNDGRTQNTPKASVQAILSSYDLQPGDVVRIDTGEYHLQSNIDIEASDGGDTSGVVTFEASPYGVTIDRKNMTNGFAWNVEADYVLITTASSTRHPLVAQSWMSVTGAWRGVQIDADYVTISRLDVNGNYRHGIRIQGGENEHVTVENSIARGTVDPSGEGIYVYDADTVTLRNNTICNNAQAGIRLAYSTDAVLENNVIWSDGLHTTAIDLFNSNLAYSDHNNIYATSGAAVGRTDEAYMTLGEWRTATGQETHSIGRVPGFVDVAAADFHLRSSEGSYHGGQWMVDPSTSPGVDTGLGDVAAEPWPNATPLHGVDHGRRNMGAYGGTEQASKTPIDRNLWLLEPIGAEVVSQPTQTVGWTWVGTSWKSTDALRLEASADSGGTWSPANGGVAVGVTAGNVLWDVSNLPSSPKYRARMIAAQDSSVSDASLEDLQIRVNGPITYYVNDGAESNDAWSTAPGNDSNDGLTPATPRATVQSILEDYDLEPGDIVRIDTGTYVTTSDVQVTAQDGGDESAPVRFEASPYGVVMDRGNLGATYVWKISADFIHVTTATDVAYRAAGKRWMEVTGAATGIYVNADYVTLSKLDVNRNYSFGIFVIGAQNDHVTIENCIVRGTFNWLGDGIQIRDADRLVLRNNTVYGNARFGVHLYYSSDVILENNIIWADGGEAVAVRTVVSNFASSDYNSLYATNEAAVGETSSVWLTLADWQSAVHWDPHSIDADPLFADRVEGDFHLKAVGRRYDPKTNAWVQDTESSQAIDAGRPTDAFSDEPLPNGGRVNMGAYGNTAFASTSGDTGPNLTGWLLLNDTGVSTDDRVTHDQTPILQFFFDKDVELPGFEVSVVDPDSQVISTVVTGWGTDTLTVSFASPLSESGSYTTLLDQGNIGSESFILDVVHPGVKSLSLVDSTTTAADVVRFDIEYTEPVFDVNTDDFALLTSGLANARIVSAQSQGNGYRVTVNTGMGSGTLRLSSLAESVLDVAGNTNLESVDSLPYTIDKSPPLAPVITGIDEDTGSLQTDRLTNDRELVISGTAELETMVGITRVGYGSMGTIGVGADGHWALNATGTLLPDGVHTFTARATDLAGNISVISPDFVVTVDTVAPSAERLKANLGVITDRDVGLGKFTLTASFSERMDTQVAPTITFPTPGENPLGDTLVDPSGVWLDERTYVVTYGVADENRTMLHVDIRVSGGSDTAGNAFPSSVFADVFSVQTASITAPEPTGWAERLGRAAAPNDDAGQDVVVDEWGNVYVTGLLGYSESDTKASDFHVSKYSPEGVLLWSREFVGSGDDRGMGISVDAASDVYVTGYFQGTADFDPTRFHADGRDVISSSGGSYDIFLLKLDESGEFMWVRDFGQASAGADWGLGVAGGPMGRVLVTGSFTGQVDFDPIRSHAGSVDVATASGNYDAYVLSLDSSGDFMWVATAGGIGFDRGTSVAVDDQGNVYATGVFQAQVAFDPHQPAAKLVAHGSGDLFVWQLDAEGNFVRAVDVGDGTDDVSDGYAIGNDIAVDDAGNVYVAGAFRGEVDVDPDPAVTATRYSDGGSLDILLLKLDGGLDYQWAVTLGDKGHDEGYGVAVLAGGEVLLAGAFQDSVDFDGSPAGTYYLQSPIPSTAPDVQGGFLLGLSPLGEFRWGRDIGGVGDDGVASMALGPNGAIALTGRFSDTVSFHHGDGKTILVSGGGTDTFVLNYAPPAFDFGDAPAPYPTRLADGGAHHVILGPLLGTHRDSDVDGHTDGAASGDDSAGIPDDEDGVILPAVFPAGAETAYDVHVSATGYLNAWLDFNGDGDWADAGEQILDDRILTAGDHRLAIDVPIGAAIGTTFARFRLSSQAGLGFSGQAPDGEVEDYPVVIADMQLTVSDFEPTSTGFVARFNSAVDPNVLNLVEGISSLGLADVTLVGAERGRVPGSLIVSPDGRQINFVETAGTLEPDTYTVTLRSGFDAFRGQDEGLLDGDGDGTAGDNFSTTFVVQQPSPDRVSVSLPNFSRGPEESINLPGVGTANEMPLTLSRDVGISRVELEFHYDPALLSISSFALAHSVVTRDADATLAFPDDSTVTVTVNAPNGFSDSEDPLSIGTFQASVPADAPYGAMHVLDIRNLRVYDNATTPRELPAVDDDGVHIVALQGDANGSRGYDVQDVTLVREVIGQLMSGLPAYRLADPLLIADLTGNSVLQANDTTIIQRAIEQGSVTSLPPAATTAAATRIFIPRDLTGSPGGTVDVPIRLEVAEAEGLTLSGFDLVFELDQGIFSVEEVRIGAALAGYGFAGLLTNPAPGRFIYTASSGNGTPLLPQDTLEDLVSLQLKIADAAAEIPATINLRASLGSAVTSAFDNGLSELSLDPVPNDNVGDGLDGLIRIQTITTPESVQLSLVPVAIPTRVGAIVPPVAIQQAGVGASYYVELWVQDRNSESAGIQGGSIDLHYSNTTIVDAVAIYHQDFDLLPSGMIRDEQGLIDDLGGAVFDAGRGEAPNWTRLAYVQVRAAHAGRVDYSITAGQFAFALSGVGNVDWSEVDFGSTAVVEQVADGSGAQVDVRLVRTPTGTELNGEVDTLPPSVAWFDEYEPYWAEIWLSTPNTVGQGISAASLILNYTTQWATAKRVDFNPEFIASGTPDIDDDTGLITGIQATTGLGGLGADRPVLLGRVLFEPTVGDQAAVDVANKGIGPYPLLVGLEAGQVELDNTLGIVPVTAGLAGTAEIWAVPFDVDDNHSIDFGDFAIFAPQFGKPVVPEDPFTWWADFDQSGTIDFGDFALFAPNFGKARPAADILYSASFPDAYRSTMLQAASVQAASAPLPETRIKLELVAVAERSASDTSDTQPESIYRVTPSATYHLEIWAQQTVGSQGISGGSIDIQIDSTVGATLQSMNHTGQFSLLTTGSLVGSSLVDDFGGATLSAGQGAAPQWVRLGSIAVTAATGGVTTHTLEPGNMQFSLFGVGNVPWAEVAMDSVAVRSEPNPWHNAVRACDVNGNGICEPLDVLLIIDDLNQRGARILPEPEASEWEQWRYLDTSDDGFLTAFDVLVAVNAINADHLAAAVEGEAAVGLDLANFPQTPALPQTGGPYYAESGTRSDLTAASSHVVPRNLHWASTDLWPAADSDLTDHIWSRASVARDDVSRTPQLEEALDEIAADITRVFCSSA